MAQSAEWIAAARLVRRAGFGATGTEVDRAARLGPSGYLRAMFAANPGDQATPAPSFTPISPVGKGASEQARKARNKQVQAQLIDLASWWVRRMATVSVPVTEKLTFCWHNHFSTSAAKVRDAGWMLAQNEKLRAMGRGQFRPLAYTMLTDAAMLRWLDGEKNTAQAPNENLSREFMELFALGHGDGYTETDVRAGATALSGWQIRRDGSTFFNPKRHGDATVTFLGVTGQLGLDQYLDAVLARPASPGYIATRWWGQLVSNDPPPSAALTAITDAYGPSRDLGAMFTSMLTRPEFPKAEGTYVIGPVEWLIGAVRALRVPLRDDAAAKKLLAVLRGLGELPFYPPNVGGWPSGQAWLSTAAADLRMRAALALVRAGNLSTVTGASSADRIDAAGYLLGVGSWSDRSAAVLRAELGNPDRLVAVALNTPEYLVH